MTKIKCLICGDVLEGDKKGTFMQCKCENVYIDETEYYCRVGYKEKEKYKVIEDFKIKKQKKEKVKNYEKERRRIKANNNKTNKN